MMSAKNVLLLTAAALAATATPVEAQSDSKYGAYSKSFGNSHVGGRVFAYAGVRTYRSGAYQSATAELLATADASVLNRSKRVAKVHAYALSRGSTSPRTTQATFKVELIGSRLVNRTLAASGTIARWSRTLKMFPTDPSLSFPVGPFSVTVKGNAGIGISTAARFSLAAFDAGVNITGDASAWGHANASAAFGIPGAQLGVEAEGKLAHQTLAAQMTADAVRGLSGSASYRIRAIAVKLAAFVKVGFGWLSEKWSKTLVEWKSAEHSRTLFRL